MEQTTIYVGETTKNLVLKYPAGLDKKEFCRYLPIDENPANTSYYLKLEFQDKPVIFQPLIDEDKSHGIKPASKSKLEKLASEFMATKI